MRRIVAIALLAACGHSGGSTVSPDGTNDFDGHADSGGGSKPLKDTYKDTMLAAAGPVRSGDTSWRIWGQGSLGVSPVFTAMAPCGVLVGYTTADGHGRVAVITAEDGLYQVVQTHDLGPYVLRGLAAGPDVHYAALLWDPSQNPAQLHVQSFDGSGTPGWSTPLTDALAAPTDFGIGDSRLEYGGGKYAAYYHVHGISGFAMGHEGDQLMWLDAQTGQMSIGWEWGCSHSMSAALRASGSDILSACVTDCYPGTSGSSIGGVYLDHATKVLDVFGGCNGSVAGELGSLTPAQTGWKLVWNSHQAMATPGGSYMTGTMNQDIAFVSIGANRQPGTPVWLTSTPAADESDPTIARYGTADEYLVGWKQGATTYVERVSTTGTVLESAVIPATWGERDDPFRTDGFGNVVWAWFDAPGAGAFHLAQLGDFGACNTL